MASERTVRELYDRDLGHVSTRSSIFLQFIRNLPFFFSRKRHKNPPPKESIERGILKRYYKESIIKLELVTYTD